MSEARRFCSVLDSLHARLQICLDAAIRLEDPKLDDIVHRLSLLEQDLKNQINIYDEEKDVDGLTLKDRTDLLDLVRQGKRNEAIKMVRAKTGLGLRESHDYVMHRLK